MTMDGKLRALLRAGGRGRAPSYALPPELVRRRPGMYVGDVHDGSGVTNCVLEILANAIDQHLAGAVRRLAVSFEDDAIVVEDDGPGIALSLVDSDGTTNLERVLTTLSSQPTVDGHFPHIHLRSLLSGCGLAAVGAVAKTLSIETVWREQQARLVVERGQRTEFVCEPHRGGVRGTRVRFAPDPAVFDAPHLDRAGLRARCEDVAWWLPTLAIHWEGAELPGLGGAARWVRQLAATEHGLAARWPVDGMLVDLALAYADDARRDVRTWVNLHPTVDGAHERGLFDALVAVAREEGSPLERAELEERLARGLVARVHLWMLAPEFGAPTRDHLASPNARRAVGRALASALAEQPRDAPFRASLRARFAA